MSKPLEKALLILNPWVKVTWGNWVEGTWYSHANKSFALKQFVTYAELHQQVGYDESKNNHDVRNYLQKLGTEVGRNMFGENVWIDYALRDIDKMLAKGRNVVITGIRFPNELEGVKARQGLSVWVERTGYGPVNSHASDNTLGMEDFDKVLWNDGTLTDLKQNAYHLIGSVVHDDIYQ